MSKLNGVIILGSSRSDGNTFKVCKKLQELTGFEIIDIKTKNISIYDYEHKNKDDDFLPLIKDITQKYELILFATPIYWYSMSATLKIFFDRISDCLSIEKQIGRKLKGKYMGMISCGSDNEIFEGFNMPFIQTANYLEMQYVGDLHTWLAEDETIPALVEARLEIFAQKLP